ncbi:hypothetical protein BZ17_4114 [Yersinia pseudotuberculosis IP 32953]|uniref:hypothetical protein n=1 Tax=Yersinia pseudotuberculosis TaxID=633 RepID=UPI00017397C9|nr:hypothetical protein [Yersinia pseudotuberculosis]CQD57554.1 Uncharacterised protein [Yersinia intermedia]AJJ03602.1 hypothetical protein BZ21_1820 [Yersinia pseudotuberculosis]AJJ55143.1 hypothetical protein BZ17_4114 [Yersinia pseudotuberculosis IP 32953]AJJ69084.1 hypothetical protein BZ16_1895 [Yersinia pseudotuberculosis PB1/+]AJJ71580.1 hypothetical protein BZ23_2104 [Yersinia pseudotuberculosis]
MIDMTPIDYFKNVFLKMIVEKKITKPEGEELYLSEDDDIKCQLEKNIIRLNQAIDLFVSAESHRDELAMRAALLDIRVFMMSIYGVFYQSVEDIDFFIRETKEFPFPEDYQVPEHYNYRRE